LPKKKKNDYLEKGKEKAKKCKKQN